MFKLVQGIINLFIWRKKVDEYKQVLKQKGLSIDERSIIIKKMQKVCRHPEILNVNDTEPDIAGNMFHYNYCSKCRKTV